MPQRIGDENTVNLTISLCLTYTLCIACVRVWIRKGAFGSDDAVIAVATLITLCNAAASYAGLAEGLGAPWLSLEGSEDLPALNAVSSPLSINESLLMPLPGSNCRRSHLDRRIVHV